MGSPSGSVDKETSPVPRNNSSLENMPVSMNTIVFMDTETSSLPPCKMTELSCLAVSVGDILDLGLEIEEFKEDYPTDENEFLNKLESIQPRVINKLTMALNPGEPIRPKAVELSGL